jgi:RecA/RadA recombinase
MASSPIIDLRNLLASRFPHLRQTLERRPAPPAVATGVAAMDQALGGGLPRGEFTELVASGHGTGSVEVLHQLLRGVARNRQFLALIDGCNSFDVGAVEPSILTRLLWVRCLNVAEALQATDLLLRDRNFPVVALDLKLNPLRELRKIGSSIWHRYVRLLEQNQATVLVITPVPMISVATARFVLESGLGLEALTQARAEVLARLRMKLTLAGRASESSREEWRLQAG